MPLPDDSFNDIAKKKPASGDLVEAVNIGQPGLVKYLLECGADVNDKDSSGNTALSWAAFNCFPQIVCLLISKGADVHEKNNNDETSLMRIAQRSIIWDELHLSIMHLLIGKGVALDAQNKRSGDTALHLAVRHGHIDVVRLLTNMGASAEIKNESGQTALDLARHVNIACTADVRQDMVQMISEYRKRAAEEKAKAAAEALERRVQAIAGPLPKDVRMIKAPRLGRKQKCL